MKNRLTAVLSLGLALLMIWGLAGCVRPRPNPSTPEPTQLSLNPTTTVEATSTAEAVEAQGDPTATSAAEAGVSEATSVPTVAAEQPTAVPEEPTAVPEPPTAVPEQPTAVPQPTAAPVDSVATASSSSTYEVRWGDTLTGIARRFGTTIEAILAANPKITDRNRIYSGMVLTIPGASSGGQPPTGLPVAGEAIDYVVQYGDTLTGIARRFGITVEAILQENPWITNRNYIPAGKHLAITPAVGSGGGSGTTPQSYRVVAGDTLTGIARRFNTTVWAITVRNNIANPNLIYAGQVLVIP